MTSAASPSLSVIGAGLAGCALAARLRRLGWPGPIDLWEMGRGAGGRATSRRSRHDPILQLDHGAPLFNLTGLQPPALLGDLLAGGWIEPWRKPVACLDGDGRLREAALDPLLRGRLYCGSNGMEELCNGLLALADTDTRLHPGQLVRQLERSGSGGWRLLDGQGHCFAESDWLVITGNLLAHQRSVGLLGWQKPPLAALAEQLNDPRLQETVRLLAGIDFEARCNLLAVLQGEAAAPWRALPFRQLGFIPSAQERWGLRRLSIQPQADGRCGVVVHSSAAFAATRLSLVGRGSLAEEMQAAQSEQRRAQRREQENGLLTELATALEEALAAWLQPGCLMDTIGRDAEGASLMRWGAAFPIEPGLPEEFTACPELRLGFCGDLVQGVGFGRLEGSLRSAESLAERLLGEI
jgi:hypothetical protein